MAPEQLAGEAVTRRSDIYAAGVVLWETLTGKRLFRGETDVDTVQQVVKAEVPRPSEIVTDLDPAFDAVVMKAIDRDPERRFPTAAAFAEALEELPIKVANTRAVSALVHDLLGEATALAELGGALADLLVERREGGVPVVQGRHLLHRHHDGGEIALGGGVLERGGTLLAMEQELDATETALHLADARDHAHRIQDVRARLLGVVLLCHGEHEPVAFERRLDGAQGARSPGRDGSGQAREDDGPAEGEDREGLARAHRVGSDRVIREVMVPPRSKGRSALTYDMLAGNATFHRLPDVGPAMAATGRRTTRAA